MKFKTRGPSHWYRHLRLFHSIRICYDHSYWMDTLSEYDSRGRVCVSVRTRFMQQLKFGRLSACLLAKTKIRVCAWLRGRFADGCGPSNWSLVQQGAVVSKQRRFRNNDKSKNENHTVFLMSPPTEWIEFALCWPRWLNVRGLEIQEQKDRLLDIVASDFSIQTRYFMTPPTEWLYFEANPGHTVEAGVRMSAHAFAATVKVGSYSCVSAS